MNAEYVKIAFEMLGTSNAPHEHRESFPHFINSYLSIAGRKKNAREFKEQLIELFNTFNIESVSFNMYYDRYDSVYSYSDILPEKCFDELYDILNEQYFGDRLLQLQAVCENKRVTLSKNSLNTIVEGFFTKEDNDIFYSIENYERNLLNKKLENNVQINSLNKNIKI